MKVNLMDIRLEDLYEKIDLKTISQKLETEDEENRKNTISLLSNIYNSTKRKDVLYVLYGYYALETKTLDEKQLFVSSLGRKCNYKLYKMILKDLSQYKNFYRRKYFVDDTIEILDYLVGKINDNEKDELEEIVQNSLWGQKLKDKFINIIRGENIEEDSFLLLFK